MVGVAVKANHLTWNGRSYFRGGAENVELGSIGEKRTPILSQNYLEVKDRIPAPKINDYGTVKVTSVDLDIAQSSSSSFGGLVSVILGGVPVSMVGSLVHSQLSRYDLKLLKMYVLANDMKAAANHSPAALSSLAAWGGDARIAHEIWVVMEASWASEFNRAGSATLSIAGGILKATAGTSSSGAYTASIPPGATFAYLLASIDWNSGKSQILDLDDDQWSFS